MSVQADLPFWINLCKAFGTKHFLKLIKLNMNNVMIGVHAFKAAMKIGFK